MTSSDPLEWALGDVLHTASRADDVIVQQLNCIAVRPHGLSALLAKALPYCDVYARRRAIATYNLAHVEDRPAPGTISVSVDPDGVGPTVVGLYGQYAMGAPGRYRNVRRFGVVDDADERAHWFVDALRLLRAYAVAAQRSVVTFPGGIGCNLARGSWPRYVEMLREFARDAPFRVRIVCVESRWLPKVGADAGVSHEERGGK